MLITINVPDRFIEKAKEACGGDEEKAIRLFKSWLNVYLFIDKYSINMEGFTYYINKLNKRELEEI